MHLKFKSKRSIINYGNSRAVTLPFDFAIDDTGVVIRKIDDVIVMTPQSKDTNMVLSGDLANKLELFIKKVEEESEKLKELEVLKSIYRNNPDSDLASKIRQLERQLDLFRLHDEEDV